MQQVSREAADRAAIEALHRKDVAATKSYDVETLVSLWTDDIVALPPGQAPMMGKERGKAQLEAGRSASRDYEAIEYQQDWQELKIAGDIAYEWGAFTSVVRSRKTGDVFRQKHNVMRILQLQPDDSWKVHRTIWNEAPKPN